MIKISVQQYLSKLSHKETSKFPFNFFATNLFLLQPQQILYMFITN